MNPVIELYRGGKLGRGKWRWRAIAKNGRMLERSNVFDSADEASQDALLQYLGWPTKILRGPAKPRQRATPAEINEHFVNQ